MSFSPFNLCHLPTIRRNSHTSAEGASLQRSAAQEARACQADRSGGDRDLGGRGGAGPLGDQSLLREVENETVTLIVYSAAVSNLLGTCLLIILV